MKIFKTVGNGSGSLIAKTNWRTGSTFAASKRDMFSLIIFEQKIHSSTLFSQINLKSAFIFSLNKKLFLYMDDVESF